MVWGEPRAGYNTYYQVPAEGGSRSRKAVKMTLSGHERAEAVQPLSVQIVERVKALTGQGVPPMTTAIVRSFPDPACPEMVDALITEGRLAQSTPFEEWVPNSSLAHRVEMESFISLFEEAARRGLTFSTKGIRTFFSGNKFQLDGALREAGKEGRLWRTRVGQGHVYALPNSAPVLVARKEAVKLTVELTQDLPA